MYMYYEYIHTYTHMCDSVLTCCLYHYKAQKHNCSRKGIGKEAFSGFWPGFHYLPQPQEEIQQPGECCTLSHMSHTHVDSLTHVGVHTHVTMHTHTHYCTRFTQHHSTHCIHCMYTYTTSQYTLYTLYVHVPGWLYTLYVHVPGWLKAVEYKFFNCQFQVRKVTTHPATHREQRGREGEGEIMQFHKH